MEVAAEMEATARDPPLVDAGSEPALSAQDEGMDVEMVDALTPPEDVQNTAENTEDAVLISEGDSQGADGTDAEAVVSGTNRTTQLSTASGSVDAESVSAPAIADEPMAVDAEEPEVKAAVPEQAVADTVAASEANTSAQAEPGPGAEQDVIVESDAEVVLNANAGDPSAALVDSTYVKDSTARNGQQTTTANAGDPLKPLGHPNLTDPSANAPVKASPQHQTLDVFDVEHNDDEYDPALPSHGQDMTVHATDAEDPAHADDEYDPAKSGNTEEVSSCGRIAKERPSLPQPAESSSRPIASSSDGLVQSPAVACKRKPGDPGAASATSTPTNAVTPTTASSSTKSPSNKRPRRDEPTSSRSPVATISKPLDKRGLRDAAWDRLMAFESNADFKVAQVSRAAFSSISSLPEFAQCMVIARFTRTPMKEIRDKNGLIMRLYHEYLKENPHVRDLQPVSAFVDDPASDPGLFEYGYAPPTPVAGMSAVPVPLRFDDYVPATISQTPIKKGSGQAGSASSSSTPKGTSAATTPSNAETDEFGRVIAPRAVDKPQTQTSSRSTRPVDPRRASSSTTELVSNTTTDTVAPTSSTTLGAVSTTSAGKPSDPRRRKSSGSESAGTTPTSHAGVQQPSDAAVSVSTMDPSEASPAVDTAAQSPQNVHVRIEKTDVFARLPRSTKTVLDIMINEGRLIQPIDDNVLTRLVEIPEPVALMAVETLSMTDLGAVQDVSSLLAGIITQKLELPATQTTSLTQAQIPASSQLDHGVPAPIAASISGPPIAGTGRFSTHPTIDHAVANLPPSVQTHLLSLVASHVLPSVDEFSEKCYEVLGQLSEGLANEVLTRFANANLTTVRNRSGFLIGVVKKCRQEYGFN